jgi:hypothetical protein
LSSTNECEIGLGGFLFLSIWGLANPNDEDQPSSDEWVDWIGGWIECWLRATLHDRNGIVGSQFSSRKECEVIMMVGLPMVRDEMVFYIGRFLI